MAFLIVLIVLISAIIAFVPKGKGIDPILGIYKVVVHPGRFHADETLGCGGVKVFAPNVIIERRVPTAEDFADPTVLVMDIGERLDYVLNNVDHHQNGMLPAACVLMLEFLPLTDQEKWVMYFLILDKVSRCDIGLDNSESFEYNGLIRAFNTLKGGFEKAVELGENAFRGYLNTARQIIKTSELWVSKIEFDGNVAIYNGKAFLAHWQMFAKADGIDFLIMSAGKRNPGEWQVMAADKDKMPIGVHPSQTFRHKNAFLAIYPTKEDAIAHICG